MPRRKQQLEDAVIQSNEHEIPKDKENTKFFKPEENVIQPEVVDEVQNDGTLRETHENWIEQFLEFFHDPKCNCPVNAAALFYRDICLRKWSEDRIAKVPTAELTQDLTTILDTGEAMFCHPSTETHDKYIESMKSIAEKYTPTRMRELGLQSTEPKQIDTSSK